MNDTNPLAMTRAARAVRTLPAVVLLVAVACIDISRKSGSDSGQARATPTVSATSVNQATYGLRSRIRWLMPHDSSAILVVVDPVVL